MTVATNDWADNAADGWAYVAAYNWGSKMTTTYVADGINKWKTWFWCGRNSGNTEKDGNNLQNNFS